MKFILGAVHHCWYGGRVVMTSECSVCVFAGALQRVDDVEPQPRLRAGRAAAGADEQRHSGQTERVSCSLHKSIITVH